MQIIAKDAKTTKYSNENSYKACYKICQKSQKMQILLKNANFAKKYKFLIKKCKLLLKK